MNWRTELGGKKNKDWGPAIFKENKRNAAMEEKEGAGAFIGYLPSARPERER